MITIKDVEHVAKLARMSLSEEEKTMFTEQLGNILEYINELNELDTENVEPMAHPVPASNIMREDKVSQEFTTDDMLSNAPQEEDGYYRVPKITDEA